MIDNSKEHFDALFLFRDAVDKQVIRYDSLTKAYYYCEAYLGNSEESVIKLLEFTPDEAHDGLVKKIKEDTYPDYYTKKKPSLIRRVKDKIIDIWNDFSPTIIIVAISTTIFVMRQVTTSECPNCGTRHSKSFNYCPDCGHQLKILRNS